MITHGRETYQPTSIMRWDRGIFNGSFEQCSKPLLVDDYPLVNKQFANLNMAIEIVDLSMKNCDFP